MRQRVRKMIFEGYKDIFRPSLGYVKNNYLYAAILYGDVLCKISLTTGEMSVVKVFNDEEGEALHLANTLDDSRIVLIPHAGKSLVIISEETGNVQKIEVQNSQKVNYNRLHVYGAKAYFLPVFRRDIAVFDIETENLSYIELPHDEIENLKDDTREFGVVSSFAFEEKIYLMCSNPNAVIEFDCRKSRFKVRKELKDFMSMCFAGGYYWVGKADKTIEKYADSDFKSAEVIKLPEKFETSSVLPLSGCRSMGDAVVFWSFHSNMSLKVDAVTGKCEQLNLPEIDFECEDEIQRNGPAFVGMGQDNMLFYSEKRGGLILCDVLNNAYRICALKPNEEIKAILSQEKTDSLNMLSFIKMI